MSDTVRVFVNGIGCDAPASGTAIDAIAVHSASDAQSVRDETMIVTDSRGLPVPAETPLFNGAVFRLIPNRGRDAADPATHFDE
ncbi:MAG: hypothetical protein V4550_03250 [Gemmatimonadota bacterium]